MYLCTGNLRNYKPQFSLACPLNRFNVINVYYHLVSEPSAGFMQQFFFVFSSVFFATNYPENYSLHLLLQYLAFIDVNHVLEDVVEPANAPTVGC
jgi:hypothetical protein